MKHCKFSDIFWEVSVVFVLLSHAVSAAVSLSLIKETTSRWEMSSSQFGVGHSVVWCTEISILEKIASHVFR
jgi:hypothetical protein